MNKIKSLQVFYNDEKVGTLALTKNNIVAFEYDNEWLNNGFSISPYSLPLKKQVFIPKIEPFDCLYWTAPIILDTRLEVQFIAPIFYLISLKSLSLKSTNLNLSPTKTTFE